MSMVTICFIKIRLIEYITSVLNGFRKNIQFTNELESNAKVPFLDVLLMRNDREWMKKINK